MNRSQIVGMRLTAVSLSVVLVAGLAGGTPALADNWKAKLQQTASVAVTKVDKASVKVPKTARFVPAEVTWPTASEATVQLAGTPAGRLTRAGTGPMKVGVPQGAKPQPASTATVRMLDRATSDALVGLGVVATVTSTAGAPVQVSMDYSGFADAGGAGYGSRLQLVTLPECALTTPQLAQCQVQTPLETVNDSATHLLTATLPATSAVSVPGTQATPTPSSHHWAVSTTRTRPAAAAAAKLAKAAAFTAPGAAAPDPTRRCWPTRSASVPRMPSE